MGRATLRWCGNPFPHLSHAGILSRDFLPRSVAVILAAAATMATLGCTGSGTAKVVPVMRSDFTDQEPLIQNIPVSEAYWWIGDDKQVNVALKFHAGSLLGRGFEFIGETSTKVF